MSDLLYGAETRTFLVADMNTLEASTLCVSDKYLIYADGLMSPMQRRFSDLICQPLVTSYVIDAYLCFVMLHAWTLEYQHTTDEGRKPMASWRRPPGRPRNV